MALRRVGRIVLQAQVVEKGPVPVRPLRPRPRRPRALAGAQAVETVLTSPKAVVREGVAPRLPAWPRLVLPRPNIAGPRIAAAMTGVAGEGRWLRLVARRVPEEVPTVGVARPATATGLLVVPFQVGRVVRRGRPEDLSRDAIDGAGRSGPLPAPKENGAGPAIRCKCPKSVFEKSSDPSFARYYCTIF